MSVVQRVLQQLSHRPSRSLARWLLAALVGCAAALPAAAASGQASSTPPRDRAKPALPATPAGGQYIVAYKGQVADADAETDRQERGRGFRARFRYRRALKGFAARLSAAQVNQLRADPDVASVTPDRPVRAFGAVPLAAGEPTPPAGIRRFGAATATTARQASDVGVAVIDSGIDLSHSDLNAVDGTNCVTPGTTAQDDHGHGTHVAGTIAARNNGAGVLGVAPATKVYAVKVLNAEGKGSWSQLICGIDWVTRNAPALNISVANMSLGGPGSNDNRCGTTDGDVLHQAICRSTQAGVMNIVAAGNDGWDIGDSPPDAPASYPEVLTVTAMSDSDGLGGGRGAAPTCRAGERDDVSATFSNYASRPGDTAHMIAAPGVCIRSTVPGGGYGVSSGTSMASPHIAGAVAQCLAEAGAPGPCAGMTPAQMIDHMRTSAASATSADGSYGFVGDPLRPNSFGHYFGYLAQLQPDTTAPETTITSGPEATTKSTTPTFVFEANDASAAFECRVDGGAWAACSSPHQTATLSVGTHSFEARAGDAVGNRDATPAAWTFRVDPEGFAPTASSEGATEVGQSSARLTGAVNANGSATTYFFEYGPTAAYGRRTADQSAATGTSGVSVSAAVSALTAATTYHYRLVATNAAGTTYGADRAFTTAAAAPTPPPPPPTQPGPAQPAVSSPAPVLAPTPPFAAGPGDWTPPRLSLGIARQRLGSVLAKGLRVTVTCSEACSVSTPLWLEGRTARRLGLSGTGRAVMVGTSTAHAAANGGRTIVVRFTATAKRRLGKLRTVTLTIRGAARDTAGNPATASRTVTLRR